MLPDGVRHYLLTGLGATPIVVDRLLAAAVPADYDRRPDPERFTLREVMAHLADWEGIWLERMTLIRRGHQPELPDRNPDQWAADHDYQHAEVGEQQARFRKGRDRMLSFLRELEPEEWEHLGHHTRWGSISLEQMAVLILGHDGYHLRQITEWIGKPQQG